MVKMEEGRKDLGEKLSIFLVEKSSPVAMRMQVGKEAVFFSPAKRCRQMPAAELVNWNVKELPIPNRHDFSSYIASNGS